MQFTECLFIHNFVVLRYFLLFVYATKVVMKERDSKVFVYFGKYNYICIVIQE